MKSTVLCYNLKDTKKGKQITMMFGFLGFKVYHVEKSNYLSPIGILSGIDKAAGGPLLYEGEGFDDEMLVIHAASEELLDKALFLMKKERIKVELKAVVTPSNKEWTSLALYEEIKKEHQYMTKMERNKKD